MLRPMQISKTNLQFAFFKKVYSASKQWNWLQNLTLGPQKIGVPNIFSILSKMEKILPKTIREGQDAPIGFLKNGARLTPRRGSGKLNANSWTTIYPIFYVAFYYQRLVGNLGVLGSWVMGPYAPYTIIIEVLENVPRLAEKAGLLRPHAHNLVCYILLTKLQQEDAA